MQSEIKIGTRESELAVWQATLVKDCLQKNGFSSTLVYIKSEGDTNLTTPLYEMGVQGIFTRSLDIALLNNTIDIAVHSMKDVPTQLPEGLAQGAVLKRANYKDLFVINNERSNVNSENMGDLSFFDSLKGIHHSAFTDYHPHIATSSIRRKAQWLYRYPESIIDNIRGNVNTRLQKLVGSNWHGAIFAAAGLERINKRPAKSIELDWMLPAPAQGAIMVAARKDDKNVLEAVATLNDIDTAICTKIERDFLRELLGGCSTPISALARVKENEIHFEGNIFSLDGKQKVSVNKIVAIQASEDVGIKMAHELLKNGGKEIADAIRNAK